MTDCIFCSIVAGKIPSHKVWEDEKHLAILSIFPNIKGFTVVLTKEHLPSNVPALPKERYDALLGATRKVAGVLNRGLGVARTAIIVEGMGVDHAHTKLFPLIGVADDTAWEGPSQERITTYFDAYPGYVSSHDSERADDAELAALAAQIRKVNTDGKARL